MHFLCGHSFNLRTLGDGDAACPLCAGEHRKAQELRRSNRASAADKVRCGSAAGRCETLCGALRGEAERAPVGLGVGGELWVGRRHQLAKAGVERWFSGRRWFGGAVGCFCPPTVN